MSLDLKWVSCRLHIYGSCFCIHLASLCVLVGDEGITTTVRVVLLKRDIQELELGGLGNQWVMERGLGLESRRSDLWFGSLGKL